MRVVRESDSGEVRIVERDGRYAVQVPKYLPREVWVHRNGSSSVHNSLGEAIEEYEEAT